MTSLTAGLIMFMHFNVYIFTTFIFYSWEIKLLKVSFVIECLSVTRTFLSVPRSLSEPVNIARCHLKVNITHMT